MKDMICPRCNSENIVKNGNTIYGNPKFMCKFVSRVGWACLLVSTAEPKFTESEKITNKFPRRLRISPHQTCPAFTD